MLQTVAYGNLSINADGRICLSLEHAERAELHVLGDPAPLVVQLSQWKARRSPSHGRPNSRASALPRPALADRAVAAQDSRVCDVEWLSATHVAVAQVWPSKHVVCGDCVMHEQWRRPASSRSSTLVPTSLCQYPSTAPRRRRHAGLPRGSGNWRSTRRGPGCWRAMTVAAWC
jgi:hypothetical protein